MREYPRITPILRQLVLSAPNGLPAKAVAGLLQRDYSTLLAELGERSGHKAGVELLLPIMGGREKDDGSVKSEDLAAKLPGSVVVSGLEGAADWVKKNAKKGDLVICMSCGDLYKAADMMVEK